MAVTMAPSVTEPRVLGSRRVLEAETLTGTTAITVLIPTAGASRIRLVAKATTSAPVLTFAWCAPDGKTAYTVNKPSQLALVAGTENFKDIDPHFGESALLVTITPDVTGVLNYLDANFG